MAVNRASRSARRRPALTSRLTACCGRNLSSDPHHRFPLVLFIHAPQEERPVKLPVKITINGRAFEREVEPRLLLVHFLRELAGFTGTKIGCDTSQCGACTVLVDGLATKSCTRL